MSSERLPVAPTVHDAVLVGGNALKEWRGTYGEVQEIRGKEALVFLPVSGHHVWLFLDDLTVMRNP